MEELGEPNWPLEMWRVWRKLRPRRREGRVRVIFPQASKSKSNTYRNLDVRFGGQSCREIFLRTELEKSGPYEDGQTKRGRFTEEQIIAVLREQESGQS